MGGLLRFTISTYYTLIDRTMTYKYKAFNLPNGFGSYHDFVDFYKSVLHNCCEYFYAVIDTGATKNDNVTVVLYV